jgi:RimJ/RimL family protein N-acetyltransferase
MGKNLSSAAQANSPTARYRQLMAELLVTQRLLLRAWRVEDAEAAMGIYGDAEVARWLSPAMDKVADAAAMRLLLQQWIAEDDRMLPPAGR